MKSKQIIYLTLVVNLILGNLLLPLGKGKHETLGGMISVHLLTSLIAIVLLLYLFKKINPTTGKLKLLFLPIVISGLVPLLSVYFLFGGIGLFSGELKALVAAIPFALISVFVSWSIWVPFGLLNSLLYYLYFKTLQTAANQKMKADD